MLGSAERSECAVNSEQNCKVNKFSVSDTDTKFCGGHHPPLLPLLPPHKHHPSLPDATASSVIMQHRLLCPLLCAAVANRASKMGHLAAR
jgi:hypothetical protein